jgi:hypothetical protein
MRALRVAGELLADIVQDLLNAIQAAGDVIEPLILMFAHVPNRTAITIGSAVDSNDCGMGLFLPPPS